MIRADLARSPFHGEGHRKVHAGFGSWTGSESPARGCCASCGRTDRSPRTAGVRAPRRPTTGGSSPRQPNVMWGTDGVRVFTLDDGWGWIFAAVEHWNAECVGWHVCKDGSRFAALDPIAQGLERLYGSLDADVARGLALRWITVVSTCQTTSSSKSGIGDPPQLRLCRGTGKRTVWRSGGIVRSRSKRSTAESFRTSRPSAPPWPTSWSGTTRPGVSRSLGIHADRGARGV